jgi:hypothetical protein
VDKKIAHRLLVQLAEHGVPPREITTAGEVFPMFSVGVEDWIERLAVAYLQDLSRSDAHFKLVLAPYGGGKTHFLMALAVRALHEEFAVSFVQCVPDKRGGPVRVDNPLGLYAEAIGALQVPGQDGQGVPALLAAVVKAKRQAIEEAGASDPDAAFALYLRDLKRQYSTGVYGDFAQVACHALAGYWEDRELSGAAGAAEKWLSGRMESLTKDDWHALGLRRATSANEGALGRKLLLALSKFTLDAGCHGWALLIDEVETLFTAKGKSLQAVLGAMRVMVDWSGSPVRDIPLFCAFAATPDVLEGITKYPALQQRLAVAGARFDEGFDFAAQISLDRMEIGHEPLLRAIGERLVEVAAAAYDGKLTHGVQLENSRRLARVASQMSLDINARRLYVKTWASLLLLQSSTGEQTFGEDELRRRYLGGFQGIEADERAAFEP